MFLILQVYLTSVIQIHMKVGVDEGSDTISRLINLGDIFTVFTTANSPSAIDSCSKHAVFNASCLDNPTGLCTQSCTKPSPVLLASKAHAAAP